MKVFVFTLILLVFLCALTAINALFINNVANVLLDGLENLPEWNSEECPARIGELFEYWETREDWVKLSVAYPTVDRVSEQFQLLLSCAEIGDVYGFHSAYTLLTDALSDVKRLEGFDIGNLF